MSKTKTTYANKLLDPRWQKKRLQILERDNWACQSCASTKNTLHVHHTKYANQPWDIHNDLLITYCDKCHELIELLKKRFPFYTVLSIKNRGLTRSGFYSILFFCHHEEDGFLTCMIGLKGNILDEDYVAVGYKSIVTSYNEMERIKTYYPNKNV